MQENKEGVQETHSRESLLEEEEEQEDRKNSDCPEIGTGVLTFDGNKHVGKKGYGTVVKLYVA